MKRTGTISLVVSIGVHALLLAAVMLCVAETKWTAPRIHLVYGEVGSESSRGEIWKAGEESPPQNQVREEMPSGASTDALDAQLIGGTSSALRDAASHLATPLLLTADGAGGGSF